MCTTEKDLTSPRRGFAYMSAPKQMLSTPEAARYIGVSPDFLKHARMSGKGPAFAKIGRKVIYRLCDLDAFIEKNIRTNLSYQ